MLNRPESVFTILLFTLLLATIPYSGLSQCSDAYAECSTRGEDFPVASSPEELDIYYANASGKVGDSLKLALNSLIKGHKKYNYNCVWTALAELDKDDRGEDHVKGVYRQRPIPRLNRSGCVRLDDGSYNNDPDAWNREHLFPKSHGFPKSSQHAYTDLHHLVPADVRINTDRSANDFKDGGDLKVCNVGDQCCTECKEDNDLRTWEPPQVAKGAIARMMLYMDVRYEGTDYDDSLTPDLKLVDRSTQVLNPDPNLTYYPELGHLSDLLKWHCENPVTDDEKARNNGVQAWQGNRNPFIDRPDYAKLVWNDPKWDSIFRNCDGSPPNNEASVWINEFHYISLLWLFIELIN